MVINVVDCERRGKEIDSFISEVDKLVEVYRLTNIEFVWVLEHMKAQVLAEDLNISRG